MNVVVTFACAIEDCELRIENAEESEGAILRALTYGCGMAHGYYLGGSVSKAEYHGACARLRHAAHQRIAIHQHRLSELAEA